MTDTAKRSKNVDFSAKLENRNKVHVDAESERSGGKRFLKLRLQGTKTDLKWFRRILERSKLINILDISEPFTCKGTNRYYRVYVEITRKEEE